MRCLKWVVVMLKVKNECKNRVFRPQKPIKQKNLGLDEPK